LAYIAQAIELSAATTPSRSDYISPFSHFILTLYLHLSNWSG